MTCLSNTKNIVELLNLPDEMILSIMNKVKPRELLLYSIIGIGNNRLEQLALDQCHSIDLTFDYCHSPHEIIIKQLISSTFVCIFNSIESLSINVKHLPRLVHMAKTIDDKNCLNLKYLKIMAGRFYSNTGTPYTIDSYYDNQLRNFPLFSIVPQLFYLDTINDRLVSFFRFSPIIRSIIFFEFDPDCGLSIRSGDEGLFFSQSPNITHINITLRQFDDCICLLNQLGSQLYSFTVTIIHVRLSKELNKQITLISCPNLKQLKMTMYRNITLYEQCIIPLLQRFTSIEHLTLLLAIGVNGIGPDHFIDGLDLERDIVLYMPHLRQFYFHIRSILQYSPHIELDTIRQSFFRQQQPIDCALDYFSNQYGQCQIYSLPFIGTRLDFISNKFPLFDVEKRFLNVTMLLLFDDVKPFENVFFERVTRALPRLKTLEVFNQLEQEEKSNMTINSIEFPHLSSLILHDIHMNYAEQLVCRTRLPCLVELVIRNDALLTIINQDQQQAKNNCSKVETLVIVEPWIKPSTVHLSFFPNLLLKFFDIV
ncbi:unnamed protein product [Rotaria sp. Silwood2]|nr:unnamed protein product [Rotaria sp. Silwood2]